MANPLRGEAAFEADGKSYTLVFDAGVIITTERRLDRGIGEIIPGLQKGRLEFMMALMWAGLRPNHKDVTEAQVLKIITEDLGLEEAGRLLGQVLGQAFPDPEPGDSARP